MKRSAKIWITVACLAVLAGAAFLYLSLASAELQRDKSIDEALLARLESQTYEGTEFLDSDILDVVRDRSVTLDTTMTYRVRTCGITNQKNSGRCWLFSTLNILRAEAIERDGLGEFYFSQTYGQFYDILEKSNRFFENVIDGRYESLDSRFNEWLFKKPIGDGGQFTNAAHLIDKYGVVPVEAMPERYSSTDNKRLMATVLTLLRNYGLQLHDCKPSQIQEVKEKGLSDVYRLLTACLGVPPKNFEWRGETYTPLTFRDRFVLHDMEEDYAVFMDDPSRKYFAMYEVENNRNCCEYPSWTFQNVPVSSILEIAVESLRNGRMFYVSADTEHDNLAVSGIYDTRTFAALDSIVGIHTSMSKFDQFRSDESRSVHAIAVCGVRLSDSGEPLAWLVENSYGTERGADGYIVFSNDWLEKYLYRAVFEKRFVPADILANISQSPTLIPSWNPTY